MALELQIKINRSFVFNRGLLVRKYSIFAALLFSVALPAYSETKMQRPCSELDSLPRELQTISNKSSDSHSIDIVNSWIHLTPAEIRQSITVLLKDPEGQAGFNYAQIRGTEEMVKEDFDNNLIPESVQNKMRDLADTLMTFYQVRNRRPPHSLRFTLRVSSDFFGVRVTKQTADSDGLHTHSAGAPGSSNEMDFLVSFEGAGPLVKIDGEIKQLDKNKILIFGDKVRHGSPPSSDLRLVVVGGIE
jgi:hypothetical protein